MDWGWGGGRGPDFCPLSCHVTILLHGGQVKHQQCFCLAAVAMKNAETREVQGIQDKYATCCHANEQLKTGVVQRGNVAIWVKEGVWLAMKGCD